MATGRKIAMAESDVMVVTAPSGGVSSGDVVVISTTLVGIALHDAAAAADVQCAVGGVFEVTAESGSGLNWTQGDPIYYDESEEDFTDESSGNILAGRAWKDKAATDALGEIWLNQGV